MKLLMMLAYVSDAPWYVVFAWLIAYQTTVLARRRSLLGKYRRSLGRLHRAVHVSRKHTTAKTSRGK
ncbi:hypothetical protein SAMN05421837_102837 [Amycolatopsis pretoriensis]|uniref:Uncharacterized protein n=1 Tax=Amycolatopsis pretoriensis TaxID=218821 RepID=A0A1H5QF18_9PSEU|nr:hypothetical protein [Amycolatopsis pretoriensis]SEF24733.1 hypothetical protein SAMN05421837_102837 [Amycolatopsis pretoriensis]